MARWIFAFVLTLGFSSLSLAHQGSQPDQNSDKSQTASGPERDREAGESSSKSTRIDLSPPKDDAKAHPSSGSAVSDADADADTEPGDVQEMHAWDPHRAAKNVEVGDFYYRRKNYRAALDRYREALQWKPDDAIANFRMAEALEKLNRPDEARTHYEAYLKILPHGPLSEDAQKQLNRLKGGETVQQKPKDASQ